MGILRSPTSQMAFAMVIASILVGAIVAALPDPVGALLSPVWISTIGLVCLVVTAAVGVSVAKGKGTQDGIELLSVAALGALVALGYSISMQSWRGPDTWLRPEVDAINTAWLTGLTAFFVVAGLVSELKARQK